MAKKDVLDLYAILKKRNITLIEWVEYNNIDSLKTAKIVAGEKGCFVSMELEKDIVELLSSKNNKTEELPPIVKNNKQKRKSSSKESEEMLSLNESNSTQQKEENELTKENHENSKS